MEKVYMSAYDSNSYPTDLVTEDGINFLYDKPFFLICNMPLKRKMYFEFTIDSYYPIKAFHNIPLYVGVSKEPSFGVLNSDFSIGALYYKDGANYDIMEKYQASATNNHMSPGTLYSRRPGATDVIGVGVDIQNNKISIYNNGNLFYEWYPSLFNMASESSFYFCIYSNTYYKEITSDGTNSEENTTKKEIAGHINFGKKSLEYLPPGYTSPFGYYYRRTEVSTELSIDTNVILPEGVGGITKFFGVDISNTTDTIENKSLYLISNSADVTITDDFKYEIRSNAETTDHLLYGSNVFINLPIPTDAKIYLEFTCTEGELDEKIIGIPLGVGISNTNTSILSQSTRMHLYHEQWKRYAYAVVQKMIQSTYEIPDIYTSVTPTQGKVIGVAIDLSNKQLSVYVDKTLLYTLKDTPYLNFFQDRLHRSYFFIHDEGLFSGTMSGHFNLGQEPFDMDMPDGYTSLIEYYDRVYRSLFATNIDIDCTIIRSNYKSKYVFVDAFVDGMRERPSKDDYGNLSFLMDTYTIITDEEPHRDADKTSAFMNNLIATDNDGYYPSYSDNQYSIDYEDDGEIVYYDIVVNQSTNQTVYVIYDGNRYTDAFKAVKDSIITVEVIPDDGYSAGTVYPSNKFTLVGNTDVSVSAATVKQLNVEIIQSPHQTIYVECNDRGYTSTFNTIYGTKFTASVIPDEGYTAGTLNKTSGTITSDTVIFVSNPSILFYPVTIEKGDHYKYGVLYNGREYTSTFNAAYGSSINIYIKSVEVGYIAPDIDNPIQTVVGPITIPAPKAGVDNCTLTVSGSYEGQVVVNKNIGTKFTFKRGDQVTIQVNPSDGYYIDSMELVTSKD